MASINWQPGTFRVATETGFQDVEGWLGGPFGIREERRRYSSVWTVTHLATGLRLTFGQGAGFSRLPLAQEYAHRILALADWSNGQPLADDEALAQRAVVIWNELIANDVMTMNATLMASRGPNSSAVRRGQR